MFHAMFDSDEVRNQVLNFLRKGSDYKKRLRYKFL